MVLFVLADADARRLLYILPGNEKSFANRYNRLIIYFRASRQDTSRSLKSVNVRICSRRIVLDDPLCL